MGLTERIARGPDRRQAERLPVGRREADRPQAEEGWARRRRLQIEAAGGNPFAAVADTSERSVA